MKNSGIYRLYSVSLKYKILFGFLFSVVPMLAIVMITYFPARDSALESSHKQLGLISARGGEQLDVYFSEGAKIFAEWTREDVFGMAVEYDAIDELKKHLISLQADRPEYSLILLTDSSGNILEESRSVQLASYDPSSRIGSKPVGIKEVMAAKQYSCSFVRNGDFSGSDTKRHTYLRYSFRTEDSVGKTNGYLLVYRELAEFQDHITAIVAEMRRNGFKKSRVAVMNIDEQNLVGYGGRDLAANEPVFGPSLQDILEKKSPGAINPFTTQGKTEHIIYVPVQVSPHYTDEAEIDFRLIPLCLIIGVDESEIMERVHNTLFISVLIGGIGLLAILIMGFFTVRAITGPIGNLVNVLQRYGDGDSNVRAEVTSRDEIGFFTEEFNAMLEQIETSGKALQESEERYRKIFTELQNAVNRKEYLFRFDPIDDKDDLSISLNNMLSTLYAADSRTKREDWLKTGLTQLSEKISGDHKLDDLCQNAITFIAGYTGVQIGTIFVKQSAESGTEQEEYNLIASYAFRNRKGLANSFKKGEGLVGQAALEKKIINFNEIPENYIRIESSLGTSIPLNILVVPLVYEDDVKGVIELGASFEFSSRYLDFAEQVSTVVAVAINAAIANDRLKELLEKTQNQSETLKMQQEKLQQANEELEEQTRILKDSEAKLQVQQEELQASNEEMEEKNEMLEAQKQEIEQTNLDLQTKQREIAEKARQLEVATKYKSEFLSNMSHELRTPLNSMLLFAKMLSENEEENLSIDQIESATSIHRSGQKLLFLINDILDLSKIEAGRIDLNISTVSPAAICESFEMEFKHIASEKGIEFITETDDELPEFLNTDVQRLEQVVRNLLGNAFKFTDSGSVTLRVAKAGPGAKISRKDLDKRGAVAISVQDTGPGIPQSKLDLIFEAFMQVDGSISRRHGGTGLGLSISRELSKLIGGEITAESVLNQGATFTLYIPETFTASHDDEVEATQLLSSSSSSPQKNNLEKEKSALFEVEEAAQPERTVVSGKKHILIIEDDLEFSQILSDFFKKSGYSSTHATTGELGVRYALEQKPTAIILDIGLPGIDGWAVLKELKNNPETRHIPVHIMSAFDNSSQGLRNGAVGYLTKPVSVDDLRSALSTIEHVLDNEVKELLVVEDDKGLRESILKLMATRDIHTTAVETGTKALELLRTNRFDCMILDLGLPDISGFQIIDAIEEDRGIARLPIIIFTGRNLTQEETEQLEKYSSTIVLKSAMSIERLLDETALFLHRVEQEMPESHRKIIEKLREKDDSIKGKKILLVDDDMRNAFALSKFLKRKGMVVSIADNGQKALEILESDDMPDIVLMDIMMPVMDGYEAMKEIRRNARYKDLPILALTAKAMEADREECIRCGANDYLSKPVDTTKLLSMLRIWMY